ncbi:hypothetical protein ACA910_012217 [Epithemia clementina (nom. ined.)]
MISRSRSIVSPLLCPPKALSPSLPALHVVPGKSVIRHFAQAKKKIEKKAEKKAAKRKPLKQAPVYDKVKESMGQRDREVDMLLSALDLPNKQEQLSQEEKDRRYQIGRNMVIGRFKFNNMIEHDINCKFRIKCHALRMLPRNTKLKEEALTEIVEGKELDFMKPPGPRHVPGLYEELFREEKKEEEVD